jgi:hypothetical protein
MNDTAKLIDGKPGLLEFARGYHPRHEHTIVDLEKLLRRLGFEVTDANEDRVIILGPLQTTTVCRTLVHFGGRMKVRHLEVVRALERLTETGVPVWATEAQQFEWHCKQLEQTESFQIPARKEFETREDMEHHVDGCQSCGSVYGILRQAVDWGSQRTGDDHLRELIVKSHEDPAAARRFYESVRDNTIGAMAAATSKASSRKREVPA